MKKKIVTFVWCVIVALIVAFSIVLVFLPPKHLIYTKSEKSDFSIVDKIFDDEKKEWIIEVKSKNEKVLGSISCPREPKNENPSLIYKEKKEWSFWGIFQPKYQFSGVDFIYNCYNLIVVPKIAATKQMSL